MLDSEQVLSKGILVDEPATTHDPGGDDGLARHGPRAARRMARHNTRDADGAHHRQCSSHPPHDAGAPDAVILHRLPCSWALGGPQPASTTRHASRGQVACAGRVKQRRAVGHQVKHILVTVGRTSDSSRLFDSQPTKESLRSSKFRQRLHWLSFQQKAIMNQATRLAAQRFGNPQIWFLVYFRQPGPIANCRDKRGSVPPPSRRPWTSGSAEKG